MAKIKTHYSKELGNVTIPTPADEGFAAGRRDNMGRKAALHRIRELLEEIQERIDKIMEIDPYGDIHENFEDPDGGRITDRLISLIEGDL